jgi:hypothetical protein
MECGAYVVVGNYIPKILSTEKSWLRRIFYGS